jgi:hypothetical protein
MSELKNDLSDFQIDLETTSKGVVIGVENKRCGSCKFAYFPDPLNLQSHVECRRRAAVPIALPGPGTVGQKGPAIIIHGVFPPMNRNAYCWEFKIKE